MSDTVDTSDEEVVYFGNVNQQQPSGGGGAASGSRPRQAAPELTEGDEDLFARALLRRPTTKYRDTSVGKSLTEALGELLDQGKISPELYSKTMGQFDRTILNALSQRVTTRVAFKARKLKAYQFIEGVWTFHFNDVEFREYNSFANVSDLKITAFSGKAADTQRLAGKRRWNQYGGNRGADAK